PDRREAPAREQEHDRASREEIADLPALGLVPGARCERLVDLLQRSGRSRVVEAAATESCYLLERSGARWDADLLFEAADELLDDDAVRRPDEHGRDGNVRGMRGPGGGERRGLPAVAGAVGDQEDGCRGYGAVARASSLAELDREEDGVAEGRALAR